MKKNCLLILFLFYFYSLSAKLPAIVKDWAVKAGNSTDSLFHNPILEDGDNVYVGSFHISSITGADIFIFGLNKVGDTLWTQTWSGPGHGRDQISSMVQDASYLYACGITYSGSTNNFDYVTLKVNKSNGNVVWVSTYNGSASNYDVATSIAIGGDYVFVTGASMDTTINYTTISYYKANGSEYWTSIFDGNHLMDIPFGITFLNMDSGVVITGGSQQSITDWDYKTIFISAIGDAYDTLTTTGTASGFDRAESIKTDDMGNIYIVGTTYESGSNYDMKVVKIKSDGTIAFEITLDILGYDDEGKDVVVDLNTHNVYLCGKSYNGADNDLVLVKLNSVGDVVWTKRIDSGKNEYGVKMGLDPYLNVVVTGSGENPDDGDYDFLTICIKSSSEEIWRDYYNGIDHGNDFATELSVDDRGTIYVTGQALIDSNLETITIKYRTDYYTNPQQDDSPSNTCIFYPNIGQIWCTIDSIKPNVDYYTNNQYPQSYFGAGQMNLVWRHIDCDTATADTVSRVDVSFLNSTNETKALPIDSALDTGYLNYYLGNCPGGILKISGFHKLLFDDVYSGIDAIYSSNSEGIKLYFICDPYTDPGKAIGLFLEGQDSLEIVNDWSLRIHTPIAQYDFERPRVYQIDDMDNIDYLSWQLHWSIEDSNTAKISNWGAFDHSKSLIIEIGGVDNTQGIQSMPNNADWGTYLGDNLRDDGIIDNAVDASHHYYVCGFTQSDGFPGQNATGVAQSYLRGVECAFVSKFANDQSLLWSTYYGGSHSGTSFRTPETDALGMAIDKDGNAIFVGFTSTYDFPLPSSNPGGFFQDYYGGEVDGYVVRLNSDGSRQYATLFGGITRENFHAVIVPKDKDFYAIVGSVFESTEDHAISPANTFLKGDNSCDAPSPSSGFNKGLTLCNSGTGYYDDTHNGSWDGLLIKMNSNTNELIHSTLYGGLDEDFLHDIVYDRTKADIVVTGKTSSHTNTGTCSGPPSGGEFPICALSGSTWQQSTNGGSSVTHVGLMAEFDESMNMVWSSFFGGSDEMSCTHLAVNSHGDVYVTGFTENINNEPSSHPCTAIEFDKFPLCNPGSGAFFRDNFDGSGTTIDEKQEMFISRFNSNRKLTWSTFYGGSGDEAQLLKLIPDANADISIDSRNRVYVTGTSINQTSNTHGDIDIPAFSNFFHDDINTSSSGTKRDAVLAVFGEDNNLYWGTYIGGDGSEFGTAICNDGTQYLYVAGFGLLPSGVNSSLIIGSDLSSPPAYVQGAPTWQGNADGFIYRFDMTNFIINVDEVDVPDKDLRIYPNPASNEITVDVSKFNAMDNNTTLFIYDVLGKCVYAKKIEQNLLNIPIDITKFNSSVYFINLTNPKTSLSIKLLIQR